MDHNNEIKNSSTDTATAVAVQEPSQVAVVPPAPKKGGAAKKIITAVLACTVVAGGLFAAKTYLKPDPEKIVKAAVASTYSQQQKFTDKVYSDIPASKVLFGGEQAPESEGSFSFTLNSIGGIDYAETINAIASGLTISGNTASSAANDLTDIDLSLSHRDNHIIDASLFLSPELAAVSVPALTEKVLSANPSTLAEDYKNSIFYDPYAVSISDIQMLQDSFTSALENSNRLTPEAVKKMETDIDNIMQKAAANAQYSYSTQDKLYVVTLPGADVKNAVIELCRYIYADSELAPVIRRSFEPILLADKQYSSYDEAINGMLAELEAELPDLPTTISLDIAKNVVKSAHIAVTPTYVSVSDTAVLDSFTVDLIFTETSSMAQVSMTVTEEDDEVTVFSTAQSSLKDGVYSASFIIDVFADDISLSIPFEYSLAAQGDLDYKLSFTMSDDEQDINAAFVADGTAVMENGILTCDLPACSIDISSGEDAFNSEFSVSFKSGALTALPQAPSHHIAFFDMTEQDVELLMDDVSSGFRALIGKIYGIFLG